MILPEINSRNRKDAKMIQSSVINIRDFSINISGILKGTKFLPGCSDILKTGILRVKTSFSPSFKCQLPSGLCQMASNMSYSPSNMCYLRSNMSYSPSDMLHMPSDMCQMPSNMSYSPSNMSYSPCGLTQMPCDMFQMPTGTFLSMDVKNLLTEMKNRS